MHQSQFRYSHGQLELHGYIVHSEQDDKPKPAVLIVHDWSGQTDFTRQKAQMIAELVYVGIAVDMYGQGKTGSTIEEKQALMHPLIQDRLLLRTRIQAAFDATLGMPIVDPKKIAIMGFCFGGLCALDLARAGAELSGAISIHGLLNAAKDLESLPIKAKVLALQGAADPMVPPAMVELFCKEMTDAKVDWQLHSFGNTQHAFTNPQAHDTDLGLLYSASAARRSTILISNFLEEIFG